MRYGSCQVTRLDEKLESELRGRLKVYRGPCGHGHLLGQACLQQQEPHYLEGQHVSQIPPYLKGATFRELQDCHCFSRDSFDPGGYVAGAKRSSWQNPGPEPPLVDSQLRGIVMPHLKSLFTQSSLFLY